MVLEAKLSIEHSPFKILEAKKALTRSLLVQNKKKDGKIIGNKVKIFAETSQTLETLESQRSLKKGKGQ